MGLFDGVFGKKKVEKNNSELEDTIEQYGIETAGKISFEILKSMIASKALAKQFVLEELDAARQGNQFAINFARSSGFNSDKYTGALRNTSWEGSVSELENIQVSLRTFLMDVKDIDTMVELSTIIVDLTMKEWELGKYKQEIFCKLVIKSHNFKEGAFANLWSDLDNYYKDLSKTEEFKTGCMNMIHLMAYGYARKIAGAGLFLQGYHNKQRWERDLYVFHDLQTYTNKGLEFQEEASLQALELVKSYNIDLDENTTNYIVEKANNDSQSVHSIETNLSVNQLIYESKNNNDLIEDNWIKQLWKWADENEIPDLHLEVGGNEYVKYEYWRGLPRDTNKLLQLVKLDLSKSKIKSFPKEIANLVNLTELIISFSNISSFPKEISNLINLNNINLYESNLQTIPQEIFGLKNLVRLELSYNQLKYISSQISIFLKLEYLILNENNLQELPKEIAYLRNLKNLFLDGNSLKTLPKEISELKNLTYLDLIRNNLIRLPKEICNLTKLSYIRLNNNPELVLTIEQIDWLKKLKINGCTVIVDIDI